MSDDMEDLQLHSFDELEGGGVADMCKRCGDPATHSLSISATPLGGPRKARAATAKHRSRLCEPCAVRIFAATRKAMR